MPTVVLNKKFQVVDIRAQEPKPDGRQFPISGEQYVMLAKARQEQGGNGLNSAQTGKPRFSYDSKNNEVYEPDQEGSS